MKLQFQSYSSTPHTFGLDRVYFGAVPRVFADDFEGAEICRWSAAAR